MFGLQCQAGLFPAVLDDPYVGLLCAFDCAGHHTSEFFWKILDGAKKEPRSMSGVQVQAEFAGDGGKYCLGIG
jgi:hypothetical protein